jgi:hypothetical protein
MKTEMEKFVIGIILLVALCVTVFSIVENYKLNKENKELITNNNLNVDVMIAECHVINAQANLYNAKYGTILDYWTTYNCEQYNQLYEEEK